MWFYLNMVILYFRYLLSKNHHQVKLSPVMIFLFLFRYQSLYGIIGTISEDEVYYDKSKNIIK